MRIMALSNVGVEYLNEEKIGDTNPSSELPPSFSTTSIMHDTGAYNKNP